MKKCKLVSLLALGLFFVFMMSCSKDGADGAKGTDGAAGPAGPAGPKGDAGNSVIYSAWLDVQFKPDTIHLAGGGIDTLGYYADLNVPKLTAALLSTADVKVYINTKDVSDPVIYTLPYYDVYSNLSIQASAYTQGIALYSNSDVSSYVSGGKKKLQYRYMIVPGNTTARMASPINWSDYNAVKAYLGLND